METGTRRWNAEAACGRGPGPATLMASPVGGVGMLRVREEEGEADKLGGLRPVGCAGSETCGHLRSGGV